MKRLLLIGACCLPLSAQCVMCFRTAHAQNSARSKVMNAGILVLGAPPLAILVGFAVLIKRRSKLYRDDD
jgi:hypothetical protein